MSAAERTTVLDANASAALGRALGESDAEARIRAEGARLAATLAMPTPKQRQWKYLDISTLDMDQYAPLGTEEPAIDAPEGVSVVTFGQADDAQRAVIDRHLGASIPASRSRLTALHYAFLQGGVLVQASANVEGARPVRITRSYPTAGALGTPHTLIVTGANSRLDVIEDFRSGEGDIAVLPVVEIVPGPGSTVRYTALHRWGNQTRAFCEQRTITDRDSAIVSLNLVTGGAVVKSHIESSLTGRGSSSELFGLIAGAGSEHADFYTLQDHIGPDTRSDLLFKAALKGKSRSVYYGLTRVGLEAHNADANQEDRNLLLSHEAKADSDPVLEILTNDVIRVSHGATAGPVDEEQLYYLQTRGIRRDDAEALLVHAFLGQVLDRVPDEALRAELDAAITEKLEA